MGKRLGELTKENTKCMVEVNGIRLIDRLMGQLERLHLNRIVVVIGYQGEQLREHICAGFAHLPIEFVENKVYDRTNNIYSLALAKEYLVADDTLLIESDLIVEESLFTLITESRQPNIALVSKYKSWMDGTMIQMDDENNIVNFISKKAFDFAFIDSYYKTINIYKFSKSFSATCYVPFLEAYLKAIGNHEYYEQVLRVITLIDSVDLKALPVEDKKWYEIDDIQDLDIAEALFAQGEDRKRKYFKRYGGYWRFPSLLDYCYLVNPYFPSPKLKEELKASFDTLLTQYPSGMGVNSMLAAKYFGIQPHYVAVGNGAAELIKAIMEEHTDTVGLVLPTFEEYPNRKPSDQLVIYTPGNPDFSYTVDDLIDYFDQRPIGVLLLINPDNPSGNFIDYPDVVRLVEWAGKRRIRLVVDESFVDFADGYPAHTLLRNELLEKYPHLIVVKSISKSYGVPGLRLGVVASSDTCLIDSLKKGVAIWNINSFAEYYMQIFGKYEADYVHACAKFVQERTRFFQALQSISLLRVIPSQANFFLCEVTGRYSSEALTGLLLETYNILIKDCSTKAAFDGRQYIRIAIRDQADNDLLIDALKHIPE